jgi:hypothetical protein
MTLYRGRVEAVAEVVDLRTVGDDEKHVHVGCDVDVIPGRRDAIDDRKCSGWLDRQRKRPFASSDTGAKNVTQGEMSRRPSPILAAAARKFSCVLRVVAPHAARVEAGVDPPTRRSWAPLVSSTSDSNTCPMSESRTRPLEMAALHCTLTVSAQLIRSEVSSSRHPISETLARPESSAIRSASPRRNRTVV